MKLLVVIPYFKPKIGGAENYAYNICVNLKQHFGWDVVVVTSNFQSNTYIEEYIDRIKICRLPVLLKISNTPINPFWVFNLKNIINNEKPDVINAHTPVPFISDISALVKGKVLFVLTYHGDMRKNDPLLNTILTVYEKYITRKTLSLSNSIICTSQYYVNKSSLLFNFRERISIISPGIDSSVFFENPTIRRDPYSIIFVAQLDKSHDHKGLNVLLNALVIVKQQLKSIQLHVVGDGDNVNNYIQRSIALGLESNVSFHGKISNEDLANLYRKASVTVLPTVNDSEGFGMVLLESMACGTPVIGSNIGGIPYVIKEYGGNLVEPNNIKDLTDKLIYTLNTSKAANIYRNKFKELDWKNKALTTDKLFRSLIHKSM